MRTENLENFLAIVKCKSISLAAKELCIDPSALSKQLRQLENEHGPLFTRILKGHNIVLELTPSGARYKEFAETIDQAQRHMQTDMDSLRNNKA